MDKWGESVYIWLMNVAHIRKIAGLLLWSCLMLPVAASAYLFVSDADTSGWWQQVKEVKDREHTHPEQSYRQARSLWEEARKNGWTNEAIELCQVLGRLSHAMSQLDTAVYYFKEGIDACTTQQSQHNLAVFYNNIGVTKHMQARYKEAAVYYQTAIKYARQFPPRSMPIERIYSNYGSVFLRLGLYDEAIAQLQKALKITGSSDSTAVIIGALQSLGAVYKGKGNDRMAIIYYDSAIHLAQHSGHTQNLFILRNNLAELQLKNGQLQEALDNLLLAEREGGQYHINPSYLNSVKANIGTIYLSFGNLRKAEAYLLEAYGSGLLIPTGKKDVTGQLSELYAAKKDYEKAYRFMRLYYQLEDSLQGEKIALQVSELEKKYQSAEKDKEIVTAQLLIAEQDHQLIRKDLWILIIAFGALLTTGTIVLLVFLKNRRNKNRQAIEKLQAVIAGEEKERSRLSRDLHDGVNSTLNAIKIFLAAAGKQSYASPINHDTLAALESMIESASRDIKAVAYNLTPNELLQNGLDKSIRYYCARTFENTGIHTDIQVYEGSENLPPDLSLSIYRIVQELMHNIIKHARASNVILLLYTNQEKIVLLVEDDGEGLPAAIEGRFKGLGLSSISERVQAHKGSFSIENKELPQSGVVVCIEIPVHQHVS